MTDEIKEVIEPKKQKRAEKKINITVIATNEGSSLVEYANKEGEVRRCYIPHDEALAGDASLELLEAGIPYGDDFSSILSSEAIATLHNYGLWTKSDIMKNRGSLNDALMSALVRPVILQLTEFSGK